MVGLLVLDLPIRDGNFYVWDGGCVVCGVLDLPIRDGNFNLSYDANISCPSFRPSYKGWKLMQMENASNVEFVLDLPIRDGNKDYHLTHELKPSRFRPSYKGWKLVRG